MGEPRSPRGPTGRTRKPTKEVQWVYRETSEGAHKALRVGQKRRGTLPCLSQTGEGFLFVFDFHKNWHNKFKNPLPWGRRHET